MNKETRVALWDWPRYTKETIYCVWQNSRVKGFDKTPDWVSRQKTWDAANGDSSLRDEVDKVFCEVVMQKLPLGEMIDFVFMIHNCPIPLREQMVRHRIGHKFGENYAIDVIPEIASSTWWSQTGRVKDMGEFANDGDYHVPKSIDKTVLHMRPDGTEETITRREAWDAWMQQSQEFYNMLKENGVPNEDAREVLPYGTQMDIAWKLNFTALVHVLSKRTCWIAQLGVWEPVIHGMIKELVEKVDPVFQDVAQPPCFNNKGEWVGCAFPVENKNRLPGGIDPAPPCSLWVFKHDPDNFPYSEHMTQPKEKAEAYVRMQGQFAALWGRNPRTGEKVRMG